MLPSSLTVTLAFTILGLLRGDEQVTLVRQVLRSQGGTGAQVLR